MRKLSLLFCTFASLLLSFSCTKAQTLEYATFGGGCFWCTEAVFEELEGVELVVSGYSGGEKKRNEILQMLTLEPELAILDETDSGLDIDALKIIADGVNRYRNKERSFLVITHYQRLLKYIEPDIVHVLIDGKFVKSGGKELAIELEEKGYSWLES